MTGLSIGELAERTGVSAETIRYYERAGLLTPPPRTHAGHRRYGALGMWELRAIRSARGLGFPVREIRLMLDMARAAPAACQSIRTIVEQRLARLEASIRRLEVQHRRLRMAIDRCVDESRAVVVPGATPGFPAPGMGSSGDAGSPSVSASELEDSGSTSSCACVLIGADVPG